MPTPLERHRELRTDRHDLPRRRDLAVLQEEVDRLRTALFDKGLLVERDLPTPPSRTDG